MVAEAAPIDPFQDAMTELDKLQRTKPGAKEYYSILVDIFRLYVARKKNILSLQQTSDDLISQLRGLDLPKEEYDRLSQSLRLSDFVKFAKYVPSAEDDQQTMESIRSSIRFIEQMK